MSAISAIKNSLDRFLGGRGEHSITVPVMDGPLKPNDILDRTKVIAHLSDVDNIVLYKSGLLVSSGNSLFRISKAGKVSPHSDHPSEITSVAVSPNGRIAIGLRDVGIVLIDKAETKQKIETVGKYKLHCVTALCFADENTLIVTNGSQSVSASDWAHDLLQRGSTGFVAEINLRDESTNILCENLKFPSGICLKHGDSDKIVVSECWSHRLVEISRSKRIITGTLLDFLPSYPCRIVQLDDGGYGLASYSVRSQLIEFVLREDRYRLRMIEEIPSEYWVAPSLSSGNSFKEPLQAGSVIRLGIHKPWAPSRSYGLVIRLNSELQPMSSAHSRANGSRHGVTSLVQLSNAIYVTAKGADEVLSLKLGESLLEITPTAKVGKKA